MKRYVYRALCRAHGNLVSRRFYGSGVRWWHGPAIACIRVPLNAIECWDMRHLWHPRTWSMFRKDREL